MTEVRYVTAGRRRTIHRLTVTLGDTPSGFVRQVGTERCNLDDAVHPPREVEPDDLGDGWQDRLCGWCFPSETRADD
jgi:hypothetical protein